jgi:hypothetical protein
MRFLNLIGTKYGRLTVLKRSSNSGSRISWDCSCECGRETVVSGSNLRSGNSRSCGCLQQEVRSSSHKTHGMSSDEKFKSELSTWTHVKRRCFNPAHPKWKSYGGRGITMCERWKDFALFLQDMGPKPSLRHSIDRIDNDGNYEPSNCRWATAKEQCNNRRVSKKVEVKGEVFSLEELSNRHGIKRNSLYYHHVSKQLPIEQALEKASKVGETGNKGEFQAGHPFLRTKYRLQKAKP